MTSVKNEYGIRTNAHGKGKARRGGSNQPRVKATLKFKGPHPRGR
jgi:hypothetical protein